MTPEFSPDRFRLEDKTAVVTGGAGFLGRRFCKGMAGAGARVAVVDIDAAAVEAATKEIPGALGVVCDVRNKDSVARMVDSVCSSFGDIHVLLNNAASKTERLEAFFAPFEDYDLETWRDVMAVNLDGMFLVAQAVGKRMIAQGLGGSVIQTGSIYGMVAPDRRIYEGSEHQGRTIASPAVYGVSKAATIGLSKHLAAHWADQGIRVNTLVPGGVDSGQNDVFKTNYAGRLPMGRMAEGDEMVGAAIFLASDAASYVTGHTLVVDGGWTVW